MSTQRHDLVSLSRAVAMNGEERRFGPWSSDHETVARESEMPPDFADFVRLRTGAPDEGALAKLQSDLEDLARQQDPKVLPQFALAALFSQEDLTDVIRQAVWNVVGEQREDNAERAERVEKGIAQDA